MIPAKKGKTTKVLNRKYRVAAYCRVSTDSDEQLNSYKNQLEYYTNKINSNPDWEPVEVFADAAVIIGLKTLRLKKCWKFGAF